MAILEKSNSDFDKWWTQDAEGTKKAVKWNDMPFLNGSSTCGLLKPCRTLTQRGSFQPNDLEHLGWSKGLEGVTYKWRMIIAGLGFLGSPPVYKQNKPFRKGPKKTLQCPGMILQVSHPSRTIAFKRRFRPEKSGRIGKYWFLKGFSPFAGTYFQVPCFFWGGVPHLSWWIIHMHTFSFQSTWQKQTSRKILQLGINFGTCVEHRGICENFSGYVFIFFGLNLFGKLLGWDKELNQASKQ